MEIRALHEDDDRSWFHSGNVDLDRFFHVFAGQNQFRHHIGVTYVAIERTRVLGYTTVAPGHIEIDTLPEQIRRKLPRYPLPVLRLARLAVDDSVQGKGIGAQLLRFILNLAVRMGNEYGCIGVVADVKSDAKAFYEQYGFLPLESLTGRADARPQPMPMFLSTRNVIKARKVRP